MAITITPRKPTPDHNDPRKFADGTMFIDPDNDVALRVAQGFLVVGSMDDSGSPQPIASPFFLHDTFYAERLKSGPFVRFDGSITFTSN